MSKTINLLFQDAQGENIPQEKEEDLVREINDFTSNVKDTVEEYSEKARNFFKS